MSGRVRWQRDGETITGYRKTDRRQVKRDPREKLRELAITGPDHLPVRLVFRLPKSLEAFVAPGPHGAGVQVLSAGYVRISAHTAEQAFINAQNFFFAIARERPAFTTTAVVISSAMPDDIRSRHLSVVKGCMVVSAGGLVEPRIYEAA